MLAISSVHTSRALKDLVRRNVITWRREGLAVLDVGELERIAQFDPSYLHLEVPPSSGA
jgi:hypothetical protein